MITTIDKAGRVRRGQRLVARPRTAEGERTQVDVARLNEEIRTLPRKPERAQ